MNYQEYDWSFNKKAAPSVNDSASNKNDPWSSPNVNIGTCIGNSCCSPGTIYDEKIYKCVLGENSTPIADDNKTEQFVNNVFTKFSRVYTKPDVILGNNILPSNY